MTCQNLNDLYTVRTSCMYNSVIVIKIPMKIARNTSPRGGVPTTLQPPAQSTNNATAKRLDACSIKPCATNRVQWLRLIASKWSRAHIHTRSHQTTTPFIWKLLVRLPYDSAQRQTNIERNSKSNHQYDPLVKYGKHGLGELHSMDVPSMEKMA